MKEETEQSHACNAIHKMDKPFPEKDKMSNAQFKGFAFKWPH